MDKCVKKEDELEGKSYGKTETKVVYYDEDVY